MSNVVDYQPVKRPIGERINFRMLTIITIFSLLVGIPVYKFVKLELTNGIERNGDRFDVDLKKMGFFEFNDQTGTVENVPPDYRKLDGKVVALEGFIAPTSVSSDKINNFELVYNVAKCCYGGPPKVQERIFARVPNGGTIDYSPEEIRVVGRLHVNLNKDSDTGKILTVYTLDVDHAEPL